MGAFAPRSRKLVQHSNLLIKYSWRCLEDDEDEDDDDLDVKKKRRRKKKRRKRKKKTERELDAASAASASVSQVKTKDLLPPRPLAASSVKRSSKLKICCQGRTMHPTGKASTKSKTQKAAAAGRL
jgi:hypothetical protein